MSRKIYTVNLLDHNFSDLDKTPLDLDTWGVVFFNLERR